MKRFLTLIAIAYICQGICAQEFTVAYVGGKVTVIRNGKNERININSKLSRSTIVDIPYEGKLDLLDEKNKKRYSINKPGKCDIATHISISGNSTMELTERYLSYLKSQMGNDAQRAKIVHKQIYSDYATVTRDLHIVEEKEEKEAQLKELNNLSPKQKYLARRELMHKRYDTFRDSVMTAYLAFVRKAWSKFGVNAAVPKPEFKEVGPIVVNVTDEDDNPTDKLKIFDWLRGVFSSKSKDVVIDTITQEEQSTPLFDIQKQETVVSTDIADQENTYFPFEYCGTEFKVRLDESKRVNIGKVESYRIADVLERFSGGKYDDLLYDCLQLRKEHNLNDWAYFQMVQTLCNDFFGKDTNEATLLAGYLCTQSGISIRFASTAAENGKLLLLLNSIHEIYDRQYVSCGSDEQRFYIFEEDVPASLYICDAEFPNEKGLSLYINAPLVFREEPGEAHVIHGRNFQNNSITIAVNQNLMKFYDTYPSSSIHQNILTRWAIYANTPLNPDVKDQLYPQLKKLIEGKNEAEQVHILMDLLHGIPYKNDEVVWGHDRAFFAEETLNYPFSDCEDRSILLTRWVRDLIGLRCALIYYPGHLSTLIHFNDEVNGAHYMVDGIRYTVCDPTYLGANVGMEPGELDTNAAKFIVLK